MLEARAAPLIWSQYVRVTLRAQNVFPCGRADFLAQCRAAQRLLARDGHAAHLHQDDGLLRPRRVLQQPSEGGCSDRHAWHLARAGLM